MNWVSPLGRRWLAAATIAWTAGCNSGSKATSGAALAGSAPAARADSSVAASSLTAPAPAAVLAIVLSRAIGPIELRMTAERLRALPFQWTVEEPGTAPGGIAIFTSGPWHVVVEAGAVTSIELALQAGVQAAVNGKPVPAGASVEAVGALFPGCKAVEQEEGGKLIECDSHKTAIKQAAGESNVAVQVLTEEVVRAMYGSSP